MLFQIHFQLVVRKRYHIFFIFPRNVRRKSVPFSCSFFRLCIQKFRVLYIHFTRSLIHVVLGTEEDNFPSLSNFFTWTLGRSLSIPSPVDVAVVNGRYTPGKSASRAGTGERLTGTPVVQPSFLHPSQAGVQENFRYSRKYWPWRKWSSFIFWSFSNKAFPHIDVLFCEEDLFHLIRYLAKKNKICFSWG